MAIEPSTLIEPPIAETGIDAGHNVVLLADGEKICQVELEWRIAIVIPANKAAIHEDKDAAKRSVKFDGYSSPLIVRCNLEFAPIPADARLRIASPDRFESVGILYVISHKRKFDSPVVRQVHITPL